MIQNIDLFTGPILFFGGPYSNLQATLALKAKAEQLDIPADHVICTGDVVAYCAHPVETTQAIIDWGCHVVQGNCEESLASDADDCGCGFTDGSTCDLLSKQWFDYAKARLPLDMRQWMGAQPTALRFTLDETHFHVLHGSAHSISEFIFPSTSHSQKLEHIQSTDTDVIIGGHSGIPFTQHLKGGAIWHNAGVIGMPANDGTPDVWYSLLNMTDTGPFFTHHRLKYDSSGAAAAMRNVGLAEGYAAALETGLWPSLDILPQEERTQTNHRLTP